MNNNICDFELSKKLKQIGFNEICYDSYDCKGDLSDRYSIDVEEYSTQEDIKNEFELRNSTINADFTAAPTLEDVCGWFRTTHKIFIYPNYWGEKRKHKPDYLFPAMFTCGVTLDLYPERNKYGDDNLGFNSHNEALIGGISEAFRLLNL